MTLSPHAATVFEVEHPNLLNNKLAIISFFVHRACLFSALKNISQPTSTMSSRKTTRNPRTATVFGVEQLKRLHHRCHQSRMEDQHALSIWRETDKLSAINTALKNEQNHRSTWNKSAEIHSTQLQMLSSSNKNPLLSNTDPLRLGRVIRSSCAVQSPASTFMSKKR